MCQTPEKRYQCPKPTKPAVFSGTNWIRKHESHFSRNTGHATRKKIEIYVNPSIVPFTDECLTAPRPTRGCFAPRACGRPRLPLDHARSTSQPRARHERITLRKRARASVASLAPALRYFLRPCPPRFGIAPLPSPTSQPKRQQRRASPRSIRLKSRCPRSSKGSRSRIDAASKST